MNGFPSTRSIRPRTRQSGASAVEFAFVFPIMLGVAYAGIVYSYIYVLQQSINFAAQQGAQAAVAVVPTLPTGNITASAAAATTAQARLTSATAAINSTLNWLPTNQRSRLSIPASASNCNVVTGAFAVQVNFNTAGLFAALSLPAPLGSFPYMPANLLACAVAYT